MLPSGMVGMQSSSNLLNLKPMTLQKLNFVTNRVGNTVRAPTEYPCLFCSKSFTKKKDLDFHIEVYHAGNRLRFRCPICQVYSSYKRSIVRRHLLMKHQSEDSEVLYTVNGVGGLMFNVQPEQVANANAMAPADNVRSTAGQVQESGSDNGNDGSGSSGILNAMFQAN